MLEKNNESIYGWVSEQYREVLHLGKMKKAVVIHHSYIQEKYFKIGQASFFPFPDEIYKTRFTSVEEAKKVASEYIMSWLNDTNLALNK